MIYYNLGLTVTIVKNHACTTNIEL